MVHNVPQNASAPLLYNASSVRSIATVHAPSILGLRPTGVEKLPEALERAGLSRRVGSRNAGRVESVHYDSARDPDTGFLNARAIADYARRLADHLAPLLDAGEFPLVLGGDCSILLGSMLALRRRGPHGLLFLDGHMDFYQPEANVNGEAASSELALATGYGPRLLTTYDEACPLVDPKHVVAFGFRDEEEANSYGSQPLPRDVNAMDHEAVHRLGAEPAARQALAHLASTPTHGYWIHLDADVLDDAIMPCVDYRQPGGLSWNQIETVLSLALSHPKVTGMEVTILNPAMDSGGTVVQAFVDMLVRCFRPAATGTY